MHTLRSFLLALACAWACGEQARAQAGALDSDLSTDGRVTTPPFVLNPGSTMSMTGLALQSDGRIVAVGTSDWKEDVPRGTDILVARYLPDGTLDLSFGGGDGHQRTDLGHGPDNARAVAVQADDKILVVGSGSYNPATDHTDMVVKRLLPGGGTDGTFNSDGVRTIDIDNGYEEANDVLVQADGRIVLAGFTTQGSNRDILLARLNSDGTPDPSFSFDGLVTSSYSPTSSETGVAVASAGDGRLLVAGNGSSGIVLMRYLSSGNLDHELDADGKALFMAAPYGMDPFPIPTMYDMVLDEQQRAVICGMLTYVVSPGTIDMPATFGSKAFLLRCLPDGTPDPFFGTNGWALFDGPSRSLHVQADGTFLVAGTDWSTTNDLALARILPNGAIDLSFGDQGVVYIDFNGGQETAGCSIVQADHRILIGGSTNYDGTVRRQFAMARLLNDPDIGIAEFLLADEVLLYPNPVGDELHLTYLLTAPRMLSCDLLDMQGRVVRRFFAHAPRSSGEQRELLDLRDLPPGAYAVRLTDGSCTTTLRLADRQRTGAIPLIKP